MYLKALEIHGFKSFPERTVISFHQGVTAIIGPNGSGKSNVTDAIRWVLGEQSVKTLRGSRMEDVIFTGTQTRRAMSFAEVSMTIDNSDLKLPIDYAEIQIARRLYRSGESEYYLNKTACRLRDITRLFMDTGLGRDGYSIVGQGKVDEVLSNRSEDRRRIFEEASGIVKYKTRKEEAQRKLLATEQNMLRVNDLYTELLDRLEPLKEQAEVASRFRGLSEALKKAEIALILDSLTEYSQQLVEAEEQKQLLGSDLATANLALTNLRQQNQAASLRLAEISSQIEGWQQEHTGLLQAANTQKNQLTINEERSAHLRQLLAQAISDEKELASSLAGTEEELGQRQKKTRQLERQKELYSAQLEEAEDQMQAILRTLDAAEKEIEAAKVQMDQLAEENYDNNNRLGQAKSQLGLLDSRRQTIARELLEEASNLDRLRLLMEEKTGQLAQLRQKETSHQAAYAAAKAALGQKNQELDQLSRQIEQERQLLASKAYRQKTLEDLERSYEGYAAAVKFILRHKDDGGVGADGIIGTAGSLLSAQPRCELAIETALGPAIGNIITDTEKTAASLIDELKIKRAGRATFLPLDAIRARRLDASLLTRLAAQPGFLGLASDLVQSQPGLEQAIAYLLGRVVIMESLDQALAAARKTSYSCRIVTLAGDVLSPGGAMSGGFTRQGSSGLLSRGREISQLAEGVRQLNLSLAQHKGELASGQAGLADLAGQMETAERALLDLSHLLIREETQLQSHQSEEARIKGRQDQLQTEDRQLAEQMQKTRQEAVQIEEKIKQASQAMAQCQTLINQQESISQADRQKQDDLRDDITNQRISLQSILESLTAAAELEQRIEAELGGQRDRIKKRQAEQASNQAETAQLARARLEIVEKIAGLEQKVSQTLANLQSSNTEKASLEQGQQAFFSQLESASSQISALQGQVSRLEARCSRLEDQQDDAKNKLWETYELTADQAGRWYQAGVNRPALARDVAKLKDEIKGLGTVNLAAIDEYTAVSERCEFLARQKDDIDKARQQLVSVITDLTEAMKTQFLEHFAQINANFSQVFAELFAGGMAELNLEDETDVLSCGIEIKAQPPGKKLTNLLLLSGGERCLTAIALLFAILKLRPTPFCVLDEVEAALDDANVSRFTEYIRRYAQESQFILVTHRKGTMEAADRLYGVTMQERGISRILSMRLADEYTEENN